MSRDFATAHGHRAPPGSLASPVTLHRSYLYAPGSRPEVMRKALDAGADAVVLDLEDAVAPTEKATARAAVAELVRDRPPNTSCAVHVRINRDGEGYADDDISAVVHPTVSGLRLPKCESGASLSGLDARLQQLERERGIPPGSIRIYPIIESAAGAVAVPELVRASPRVARLGFGAADFLADVGAYGDDDLATLHVRSQLVLASRVGGIGPPIDTVHPDLDDEPGLERAARRARALGFHGKSVIHPRQLAVVHAVFTPSDDEVRWARRVLEGFRDGDAVTVDNGLVDEAIARRARALLDIAERSRP